MNTLIVFSHPEPQSFNGELKNIAIETLQCLGHSVEVSDLYAENFDPVERPSHFPDRSVVDTFQPLTEQRQAFQRQTLPTDVQRELARLERADLVILQFPLWWHSLPAMLKGWFDRVMVYGGVYSGSMRYDRGYFRGKRAICAVTTGSPAAAFSPHGRGGDMAKLMWPMHCSLYYLGMDVLAPQVIHGVQGGELSYQNETEFRHRLKQETSNWADRLTHLTSDAPIPFSGWADWDDNGVLKAEHPLAWR
ncbi:NAD(P)H-dependent oxidoreductase [Aidingimonas lacisalsi]|uniref:NAD(P)H-dependent oxidoreductase n=1 Tax=Aidingimonas lacisalsi TaxID=2604086 RepID=UPI0011D2B4D6|nr:NAD(P)H-dependent oxidoreductase [Aidingimonas lacisalsi]